jgi:DNA polymerase-3 subunit delta
MSTIDDYKKLRAEINAGRFKPVYLLHGEEDYFIDRVSEEIEKHALHEHERDFNLTVLYARDTDPNAVREACTRFPMMAERQVVIVRELQAWKIDQVEKLEPCLVKPTPTTVLVLCYKHKKVDGRKSVIKNIQKGGGAIFLSDKLYADKLPAWIAAYVKSTGRKIGGAEAQLLADHLGSDLSMVTRTVEKLCLLCEEGGTLSAALIERHVGISREFSIFELQNAIGLGDKVKAQRIAHYYAQDPRDHPLVVTVEMLNRYFAKLAQVHAAAGQGEAGLAAALKVSPFFVKDYVLGARNYPPARLSRVQEHLRRTDLRSKGVGGSSASDGELLQELLERVMG